MNCPHCNSFVPENNYRCPNCKKSVQEVLEPTEFREKSVKSSINPNVVIMALVGVTLAVLVFLMISNKEDKETNIPRDRTIAKANKTSTPAQTDDNQNEDDTGESGVQPNTDPNTDADTGFEDENTGDEDTDEEEDAPIYKKHKMTDSNLVPPPNRDGLDMGYVVNAQNPGKEVFIADFVQGDQITIFDFYSDYCGPCRKISPWLKKLDETRDDIIVFKVDINRPDVRTIDFRSPVMRQYSLNSIPHFVIYNKEGIKTHEGRPAYSRVLQMLKDEGIIR